MAELVPVASGASMAGGDGGPILTRLKNVAAQPAVKRAIPWFLGVAALGGAGLTWSILGPVPQRVLYTQLDDSERASVVAALDKGSVHYHIDNSTGVLTVNEDDLYKARMLVAQNGAQMEQHLRALLHDEALAAALAASGLETIRARHACAHRARDLLAIAARLRQEVAA